MLRLRHRGISRVEVLVVVAIFVVLVGLIFPASGGRRVGGAAHRMQCQNNLKQLMLAIHSYEEMMFSNPSHDEKNSPTSTSRRFPSGCIGSGQTPEQRLSWMVSLLPFLEQDAEYQQFDMAKGFAENAAVSQRPLKVYRCPAAKSEDATSHFVAMAGIGPDAASRPAGAAGNGFMGYDRVTTVSMIKDGTSNTIALLETRTGLGPWARGGPSNLRGFDPNDVPAFGDHRPFGGHTGGINAAMADGSVRFLRDSTDPANLAAMITIAGGEPPILD